MNKENLSKSYSDQYCFPVLNGGRTYSGYYHSNNSPSNIITISEGGESCGFVTYMEEYFWAGGHIYKVWPLCDKKVSMYYAYQLLKFKERKLMAMRVGSTMPNIQINDVKKMELCFPPEYEQRKVAYLLSKIDDLILGKLEEINYTKIKYKRIKRDIWKNMSDDYLLLSEIATIKTSKRVTTADYKFTGIPFLKGSDLETVSNSNILCGNYISIEKYTILAKKYGIPKKNDILITGNGTIGKTFQVHTNDLFYFKDGIIWISDIKINESFLFYYIKDNILNYAEKLSYGSTITNLNIEIVRQLPIPIIDENLQKDIVSLIYTNESFLVEQKKELEHLKNVKQFIISNMLM